MKAKHIMELAGHYQKMLPICTDYDRTIKDAEYEWVEKKLENCPAKDKADYEYFRRFLSLCKHTTEAACIFEDWMDREIDAT